MKNVPFILILFVLSLFLGCQTDLQKTLYEAVQNRNSSKVLSLLAKNPMLISKKNEEGESPLHLAVKMGDISLVQAFIKTRADLNITDNGGNTPLIVATDYGYYPIVKALIGAGVDLSVVNNHGFSAPKLALEHQKSALLELFLEKGVVLKDLYRPLKPSKLKAQEESHPFSETENALLLGATQNHLEDFENILRETKDKGVNSFSGKDEEGNTLLGLLAQLPSSLYLEHFLTIDHSEIDIQNKDGETPLMLAIMATQIDNVRLLILSGASLTLVDKEMKNTLHWSVIKADENIFNLMSRNYRNLRDVDIQGNTVVHFAAQNPKAIGILKTLLESGASVGTQNTSRGETPLLLAVLAGNTEAISLLMKFGADPNIADYNGNTPINKAKGTPLESLLVSP